jgi:hypothetical protein
MKYSCVIEINLPIKKTVELWNNKDYFKEWQDDFCSIELISGTHNYKGSKSRLLFVGKRKIELVETILSIDLPNEKTALYEHVHMSNTQCSRFISIGKNKTKYISEVEYIKFNGILIKALAMVFPGKFKSQSQKWMNQFKAFAEKLED